MPGYSKGDSESKEGDNGWRQTQAYEIEDFEDNGCGLDITDSINETDSFEEGLCSSNYFPLEECFPTEIQNNPYPFSLASLELLKKGRGFKRLTGDRIIEPICKTGRQTSRLSNVQVMRFCGERFIQSFSKKLNLLALDSNPFDLSFAGLSSEEIEDIELVDSLLLSAEKVSNHDFEGATRLLCQCDLLSSTSGNTVQRVVYYFAEALSEKLHLETKGLVRKLTPHISEAVNQSPNNIRYHQKIPFSQVEQFAGMQVIIENTSNAKRIHVIDLCIRCGVQWSLLMQALASRNECPVELLKITAVGTGDSRAMENAGDWLMNFAKTMNLTLSIKVIIVSSMLDLKLDQFEHDSEETVVVYSMFFLWTLLPMPDELHNLMTLIATIKPSIMVVTEVEGSLNSPCFMTRLVEALFYYGTYFDCLDAYVERHDPLRIAIESHFSESVKIIVATEGTQRTVRHVTFDVWRAFFSRFQMEEEHLSTSSLAQANLMLDKFPHSTSCTLDMDGKCLLIGWKGTPLHSLSAWKFL